MLSWLQNIISRQFKRLPRHEDPRILGVLKGFRLWRWAVISARHSKSPSSFILITISYSNRVKFLHDINKNPDCSGFCYTKILAYFLAGLALLLIQRVQAFTRLPLNIAYCKLGKSLTMEARMLWERLMVRL